MTVKAITFRPTRKVRNQLKDLKNKTTEINQLLELAISGGAGKLQTSGLLTQGPIDIAIKSIENNDQSRDVVKDKKYYRDLERYKEIQKRRGCTIENGERLDTKEALAYAGLTDFIPLD